MLDSLALSASELLLSQKSLPQRLQHWSPPFLQLPRGATTTNPSLSAIPCIMQLPRCAQHSKSLCQPQILYELSASTLGSATQQGRYLEQLRDTPSTLPDCAPPNFLPSVAMVLQNASLNLKESHDQSTMRLTCLWAHNDSRLVRRYLQRLNPQLCFPLRSPKISNVASDDEVPYPPQDRLLCRFLSPSFARAFSPSFARALLASNSTPYLSF